MKMPEQKTAAAMLRGCLLALLCLKAHSVLAATKPTITSISPNSAIAGSAGFTLTLTGTNFQVLLETTSVNWNGSSRPITSQSATQLKATISATDIATAGTAQVTVSNTDALNNVATSDPATFTINPAPVTPLTITTGATLPDAVRNTAYSQTLGAAGGTPPYKWSLSGGSLPAGLSLSSDGTLSGTPTSAGTSIFSVRVQDSAKPKATTTKQLTLTVNNPLPAITGITPNSAVAGSAGFTLTVNGSNFVSDSKIQWNGSDRSTHFSSSAKLTASISSGDVDAAGTANVTVVNPSPGGGTSNAAAFTISAPLTITTGATLPDGTVNAAYSQTLAASGGTPPYTWSLASGSSLPGGLNLTASDGKLSGTPTSAGTFSFTVQVQDSASASATKTLNLTVNNPVPAITGINPTSAAAGGPGFTLTVNGSNFVSGAKVRWNGSDRTTTFSSSTKLTASISAGDIGTAGKANVTVNNPSPGGGTSNAVSFTISAQLTITTGATLLDGTVNVAYSQTLSASGGVSPYTWSVASGSSSPPGLTLTASDGKLSGTPISAGTFSFTVQVQDSASASATKQLNLKVNNPVPAITGLIPSSAVAGNPAFTLTVNGSNFVSGATVRWNGSDRTTTLSSATNLTASIGAGDIATAGAVSVTVNNPGPGGGTSNSLSFQTSNPAANSLAITTSSPLPNGMVATPYAQTLSASGGKSPYQWSISSGSLPTGIVLVHATGVLSGTPAPAGDFSFTVMVSDSTQPTPATATKVFALRINNPGPTLTRLDPASATAGGSAFVLTLTGSGFTSASTVTWNGSSRPTTFVSSVRLTASISSSDIASVTLANVAVNNPAPGGGSSGVVVFVVSPASSGPTITSSSPLPDGFVGSPYSQTLTASGGSPPYTWSLRGSGFPSGLTLDSTGVISGTPSGSDTFRFTVRVTDTDSGTDDKTFQLSINPALPAISISGASDVVMPADQPTIGLTLANTYPVDLDGQITLTFTSDADAASDDPTIQFATGGRVVNFTIPANSQNAQFPNSTSTVGFQTGTVSGNIKMTVSLQSEGNDITPSPAPNRIFTVNKTAPVVSRLSVGSKSTSGFELELIAFSTPRSLTQLVFSFTAKSGSTLATTSFTVPLGSPAASWFQSATSKDFGSLFRLVIPFTVQGDVNAVQSVSATLSNTEGASEAVTTNF